MVFHSKQHNLVSLSKTDHETHLEEIVSLCSKVSN